MLTALPVDFGRLMSLPRVGKRIAARVLADAEHGRATVPHFYNFRAHDIDLTEDLRHAHGWDRLRASPTVFGIPASPEEWIRSNDVPELVARAHDVISVIDEIGAHRVCSYGVGGAGIERHLTELRPDLKLICTDFAPDTVKRMQLLLPTAQFVQHDLAADPPLGADLHVLHRVDTELDNRSWRRVLRRFEEPVLLVAASFLDAERWATEDAQRRIPEATFAGYVRTKAAFRALWPGSFHVDERPIGDLVGFLLRPG